MQERTITISTAGSRKSCQWISRRVSVSDFFAALAEPPRSSETLQEYDRLPKSEQADLKDSRGGFVGGEMKTGRRLSKNVLGRDLLSLDFDAIVANGTDAFLNSVRELGIAYCVHSTRKHRPSAPRLRVVVPTDRTMSPDEYEPCARRIASYIGLTSADPTTFEVSRLMYFPTCCSDGEYIYEARADLPLLSVDDTLNSYQNWRDYRQWPQVPGAVASTKRGTAQADPTSKNGIIGAFCRAYSISRAMFELLPGTYEACDGDDSRFTYTGGSTTGGVVVYDDDQFAYSHHATDPCSGREVNAFDMTRLHKFGALDDEAAPATPTSKLPSFIEMRRFALTLPDVLRELDAASRAQAEVDFAQPPSSDYNAAWRSKLERGDSGKIKPTISNYALVLDNDPAFAGKIVMDVVSDRTYGIGPFPWGRRGEVPSGERFVWTDADDSGLRQFFETQNFERVSKERLTDAFTNVAAIHSFDPIQTYLKGLPLWDHVPRLDTLFIDALGAEDSIYTRAATRKVFIAAVARAMKPGVKFDCMTVLVGPQGLGKSTLLNRMSQGFFMDSISTFEGKDVADQLRGTWIVEIPEMHQYRKADVDQVKQLLSTTVDRFRPAYGRRVGEFPRRCVIFGTSNHADFLHDSTGNRRFWPIDCGVHEVKPGMSSFELTDAVIAQIWAEAKEYWNAGEPIFFDKELERLATEAQESHFEASPMEAEIREFLTEWIPVGWENLDIDTRRAYRAGCAHGVSKEKVPREIVCVREIQVELYGFSLKDAKADRRGVIDIGGVLSHLGLKRSKGNIKRGPYRGQRYFPIPKAFQEERK